MTLPLLARWLRHATPAARSGSSGLAPAARAGDRQTDPGFRWIPIRSLAPRHRPRLLAHLLDLDEHDRYLRFGHAAGDEQIARYVDQIDFERDEVFGIFNRRLVLVAMAHLAVLDAGDDAPSAEFGVSVLPHARGRGYGARLFDHAVLHARNRGIETMVIHALAENTAMLRLVRSAGAVVLREGGEAEARLALPAETIVSQMEEIVSDNAAEVDYRLKRQRQWPDRRASEHDAAV